MRRKYCTLLGHLHRLGGITAGRIERDMTVVLPLRAPLVTLANRFDRFLFGAFLTTTNATVLFFATKAHAVQVQLCLSHGH
jgi:hypothetical protein